MAEGAEETIRSEADFIPGTYTHNCEKGRAFEEKVAARGNAEGDEDAK